MAKGSIATYAAFEESAFSPAILGELLMLKSFAVYRADRSVKRVVKKVAGLVAHRLYLVSLLIFSDECLIKLTWVLRYSSGLVRNSLNSEH